MKVKVKNTNNLSKINHHAAGIDIGSNSHFVAMDPSKDENPIREFKSFTNDLIKLCDWLESHSITTVAMESTGVYWIPLYEMLAERGFDVRLVDARKVKNVSGRKSDVLDCQWLQQLHSYGLLSGAFRPEQDVCKLRAYLRQRSMLIEECARHIQHMQKAMIQMNLKLHNVVSDITGVTGMKIIRSILAGCYDAKKLSSYRDPRCRNTVSVIRESLVGNYREEHIFALRQGVELYDILKQKIADCDKEIESLLQKFSDKQEVDCSNKEKRTLTDKNKFHFNAANHVKRISGCDLTKIPGIDASTALNIISEVGIDLGSFKNSKHFVSWLGICPNNKVSGGKVLKSKTKRNSCRAASMFRMSASSLYRSQSSLGAFLRRLKFRTGSPKAITATARKIATIFYNMMTKGTEYVEVGMQYYEEKYKKRIIKNLKKKAETLGMTLVAIE